MKLLGKSAGAILWEILGPVDGRNRWSDGINAVAVVPAIDFYLNAPALTAIEVYVNTTPLVLNGVNYGPVTQPIHDRLNPVPGVTETASSPRPVTFGEGQRPDPSAWALAVTITSAGLPIGPIVYNPAIGTVLAPTWIRVSVKTPIPVGSPEGYVKMVTKWS